MTVTLAVISVAVAAALVVFVLSAVRSVPDPIDPVEGERAVVRQLNRHPRLLRFLRQRLDHRTAGGLLLTLALLATFVVALVTGLLLDMVDSASGLASLDDDIASWGAANAVSAAVDVLRVVTYLGDTTVVVIALLVTGLIDVVRNRRVEVVAFLGTVIVGEKLIVNGLKEVVDRARPDVMQLVGWQGPSFPSGHAAAAAAVWPAIALVLTRGWPRVVRAASAAAAALVAFAVAASRALLGVHWLTDVLAGLTIGYGCFVVCAVMFGGRAQRLGDPVTRRPSGIQVTTAPTAHAGALTGGPTDGPRLIWFDPVQNGNPHLMSAHPSSSSGPAAVDTTTDRAVSEKRSTRLDQLEREIAIERDRLNRPDPDDRQPAPDSNSGDRRTGAVREVDLPELEERVTESQREAWALGYDAGVADSQNRSGERSRNPFHPLRGL